MYTVESLKDAIELLYKDAVDMDGYSEKTVDDLMGMLNFEGLCQAVEHNAQNVYAYTIGGDASNSIHYHGDELFGQKATLLQREEDESHKVYEVQVKRIYELWLLEDMSLATVVCMDVQKGINCWQQFKSQYRELDGEYDDPWNSGMYISLEDLTLTLNEMSMPYVGDNQPDYDL